MKVTCLASGSSGNSLLIQHGGRAVLVDAGLSARKLAALLAERGVTPGSLDGILLSHEHSDHARGADLLAHKFGAPLVCNAATYMCLTFRVDSVPYSQLCTGQTASVGAFEVTSVPVSHDAADPVGYVVRAGGSSVAVFTDLGFVTPELYEPVSTSDLIVLEANHNEERLLGGPYPAYLKRRIRSATGHLSNLQTAELVGRSLNGHEQCYWLAHLSRTNNTKTAARADITGYLERAGVEATLHVTDRDRPSLVWESA